MYHSKDVECLNEKKESHTYAAYKRLILELNTHIDWRWRKEKFILCKWKWNKNTRVSILISDKIDLKKTLCNKRQRRALHKNKGVNPVRRYTFVNVYAPTTEA